MRIDSYEKLYEQVHNLAEKNLNKFPKLINKSYELNNGQTVEIIFSCQTLPPGFDIEKVKKQLENPSTNPEVQEAVQRAKGLLNNLNPETNQLTKPCAKVKTKNMDDEVVEKIKAILDSKGIIVNKTSKSSSEHTSITSYTCS
ncbi:MAG: hypothetical protein K0S74_845 [Chlamydiales bacterium]|jgi:hypothetical protein|nr:hypothetical protein [Chlamydiales bacterium]